MTSRRVVLKTRPVGAPKPTDFSLVEAPVPALSDGEILTPHDLPLARPLHARPHQRREVVREGRRSG